MKNTRDGYWGWLTKGLRTQFVMGILVVVPLGLTILILLWMLTTIDDVLQPLIRTVWGRTLPGIGLVMTVVLIFLAGAIASNFIGRKLILYGESLLARVPLVRQLYAGIKQILGSFSAGDRTGFLQVVLVEFPRKGLWTIGFVVTEFYDNSGRKLLSILVPSVPNPLSGFVQIAREDEVVRTRLSVNDAVKMIVSAGRVIPDEIGARLSVERDGT